MLERLRTDGVRSKQRTMLQEKELLARHLESHRGRHAGERRSIHTATVGERGYTEGGVLYTIRSFTCNNMTTRGIIIPPADRKKSKNSRYIFQQETDLSFPACFQHL